MIYEKVCPKCGNEFKTTRGYQKFCCKRCSNSGRTIEKRDRTIEKRDRTIEKGDFDKSLTWERIEEDGRWQCPYNLEVSCDVRYCNKCGWNPVVAEARFKAYMEKRNDN